MIDELGDHRTGIELEQVPFHRQVTDQCGPAALASVLNETGVPVSSEELKSRVYIPGRQGSLQLELMAATRQFGRIPYEIEPRLDAILAELDAGRPVLVLQNLGLAISPRWHYAVVVGFLAEDRKFVLRSGDHARLLTSAKRFAHSWQRADFWAIVALRPGELPADAVPQRYLRAVAAVESTGDFTNALPAYRAAAERWPENELAWLGLGNAAYGKGELLEAGSAYRQMLKVRPGNAIALNNLSQVYLELGCDDDALAAIDTALSGVDATDPVRSHLLRTKTEMARQNAGSACL
jgi:tetratricopeptide (TPR) repeat protein